MAAVQGKNANRGFVRPEQFSFTLPGMDRQNITRNMLDRKAPVRLQFAFDPRQEKVTVGANGDLLGVCQFRNEFPWQEVRKIIFGSDGWGNNSGKIAISNSWVAPWTGDLGKSPSPTPTGPQVFLANGDSSTGTLLAKDSSALVLTCDAGEIPLPPSRVHMVSWNATDKPDAAFPHRIRLMPRGQLSASTVRWEADKLVATTPWGEISLPMELVKELVWAKS